MIDHSESTKRIAKNTLMLYGRMLFSMVVSLYTSRVVLNTLGVVDYGIYGVVGGFVTMFSLISSSLSSAVSRFLTFELGRDDKDRLGKAFSTSLLIHLVLAVIIIVIAETIGLWFVNNKMTIPADRLYAANWVFQASVLSFVFGLLSVSYNAAIVSHERMSAFAYIGILDTTLRLFMVLFVAYSSWKFDRLIVYAVLLVVVSILLQCIYICYCRKHFEECRLKVNFDKRCWKEISSFAGWHFIGCSSQLLRDQGVNVLLNLFIGPEINAARGIATSVNTVVTSFIGSFTSALNPQITKSYASGDYDYMFFLVEKGARFCYYILMVLAFPIILETEYILSIWLQHFPEHTVNFVRMVLVMSLFDVLSFTLITVQLATGKIRNYQLIVGGMLLLNFPLSYVCLGLNLSPESVYVIAIIISVLCLFIRMILLSRMVNLSIKQFTINVLFNVLKVSIAAFTIPMFIHLIMDYGLARFVIVGFLSVLCSVFSILYVGCGAEERKSIIVKLLESSVNRNK